MGHHPLAHRHMNPLLRPARRRPSIVAISGGIVLQMAMLRLCRRRFERSRALQEVTLIRDPEDEAWFAPTPRQSAIARPWIKLPILNINSRRGTAACWFRGRRFTGGIHQRPVCGPPLELDRYTSST